MYWAILLLLPLVLAECPQNYPELDRTCVSQTNSNFCQNLDSTLGCACPDLRPYIPHQLQIVNQQGGNILRFAGGSTNTPASGLGGGTFEIVGDQEVSFNTSFCNSVISEDQREGEDASACQRTVQNLYMAGQKGGPEGDDICFSTTTGAWSFFHENHNHWHSTSIYEFTIHEAQLCVNSSGLCPKPEPITRTNKVTFCLIDYVSVMGNNGNNGNGWNNNGNDNLNLQRVYWDCESQTSYLGISVGFMDQYHHSLSGMDFDITDLPGLPDLQRGEYKDFFLVATANPDCYFKESDYTNNVAYTGIRIGLKGNSGNYYVDKIEENSDTCCWDPYGEDASQYNEHMCGENINAH